MYISALTIEQFGKFNNFVLKLDKGYNLLVKPNEFGKSTIMHFIYFIFYGFTKSRRKDSAADNDPFIRYMPLSGAGYLCGAVDIIDESLGRINVWRRQDEGAKGSFTVKDMNTGAPVDTGKLSPGEYLFGVDSETFLKTYLSHQQNAAVLKTEALQNRLLNLASTGDEDVSYQRALDALMAKKRQYQHAGRLSGPIFSLEKQLSQKRADLIVAQQKKASLAPMLKEAQSIDQQIKSLDDNISKLQAKKPQARAYDAKKQLLAIENLDNKIKDLENSFRPQNVPDKERAQSILAAFSALPQIKGEQKALASQLDTLKEKQKPYTAFIILAALLAGGALLGLALYALLKSIMFLVTGALCLCALIFFAYKLYKIKNIKLKITKLEQDLKQINLKADNTTDILTSAENQYGITNSKQLFKILEQSAAAAHTLKTKSELESERQRLLEASDITALKELAKDAPQNSEGLMQINIRLNELYAHRQQLAEKQKSLNTVLNTKAELNDTITTLQNEIPELEKKLNDMQKDNAALTLAIKCLKEANDTLGRTLLPLLNGPASKLLSLVTGGRYTKLVLDSDFVIRAGTDTDMYDLGYLSNGTKDALYLALRVALCDLISEKKQLPLFFDEPFSQLDDKRYINAKNMLKQLGTMRQVVIMCAMDRGDL